MNDASTPAKGYIAVVRPWVGRALLLIIVGLVVQLFTLWHVTPASFLIFAGFGVGPVFVGFLLLAWAGLKLRRAREGAP